MGKIIRLTEDDLTRIVSKIIMEQSMGGMTSPQNYARYSQVLQTIDPHILMTILQIATAFIHYIGPGYKWFTGLKRGVANPAQE